MLQGAVGMTCIGSIELTEQCAFRLCLGKWTHVRHFRKQGTFIPRVTEFLVPS